MGAVGNKIFFDCLPLPPSSFDLIRGVSWSLAALSPPSSHLAPPSHTIPNCDNFQLPRYILRMASNWEVVSMTADIGQQQWSGTFFRLSDRTLISQVKNFVIWKELAEFQADAWLLVAAWIWAISWHGSPVQTAGTVWERATHKSRTLSLLLTWRLHARFITSTRIWTRAHQPDQGEVSSWRFRRA